MLPPEQLEPHLQSHHLLHRVVVDVVSDPGAFFLGRAHDVLQESLPLLVDLFEVPDDASQLLGSLGDLGFELLVVRSKLMLEPWMVRSWDSRCSVSHALWSARAACSANCSTIAITHRRMVGWPAPRSTTTAPSPCRRPRSNGTTSTFLASGRSDASRGSVSGSMARKSWLARFSQARDTDRSIPTAMSVGRLRSRSTRGGRGRRAGTRGPLLARIRRSNTALREAHGGCPRPRGRCPREQPSRRAARGRASVYGVGARSRPRTARCRERTPTTRRW